MEQQQLPGHFVLQNSKMLKIELNGECMARTGSMVAYQGQVQFQALGSGGVGKFLKQKLTGEGVPLKAGMFFTIEPMINVGKPHVKILSDGWTAVTRDRSLSAQFEHSVGVTADGVEIFTLSERNGEKPPVPG